MPHLKVTRKGWENEHFARFLLSRIAYVSAPVFVGDDIGLDLICTLFTPRNTRADKEQVELFPDTAFAMQLKSCADPIEVSKNNAEYLKHLAMPLLVGVVDRSAENPSLSIFSGELIPAFTTTEPPGLPLRLVPCRKLLKEDGACHWSKSDRGYDVPLPFLTQLSLGDNDEIVSTARTVLRNRCHFMLQNIAAVVSNSYLFHYPNTRGGSYYIATGCGSAHAFRGNLALRLGEAFANLAWMADTGIPENLGEEFEIYARCYSDLRAIGAVEEIEGELLEECYQRCRRTLTEKKYVALRSGENSTP